MGPYRTVYMQEADGGFIVAVPSTPTEQGEQHVATDLESALGKVRMLFNRPPQQAASPQPGWGEAFGNH